MLNKLKVVSVPYFKWQFHQLSKLSFVYVASISDTRPPNVRPGTETAGCGSHRTDTNNISTRYVLIFHPE